MSKPKLTPEEQAAYRDLALAAKRLREAQEQAGRSKPKNRRRKPANDSAKTGSQEGDA